jgi:Protein of unknown function (DUF3667)
MEKNKCKNCESILYGKFCSNCGQKVYNERDKSLSSISEEVIHFMTHFDGKFLNTLKTIYRYPGKLSLDYSNGIRQKYYKPISFYLLIVILYLLFPLVGGMNMEMKYYKTTPIVGEYISKQIEKKSLEKNLSEELLSEKFNKKSKSTSKILLLLLIPLGVPLLYLLYFNRRRFVFDNIILSTEINSFFLLSIYILIPFFSLPFLYIFKINMREDFFAPLSVAIFGLYCIILFHNVFKERWWISVLKGGIFTLLFLPITINIYRIIVFETTFALI